MAVFTIKKGFDLPLEGEASTDVENAAAAKVISVQPDDFPYHKFQVLVKVGDEVKAGTPVIASKLDSALVFCATASGKVSEIRRGERRKLLGIDIAVEGQEAIDFGAWDITKISSSSKEDLCAHLKQAGMWPLLRQRPYSKIASMDELPKAIYVNAMATAPLAPRQEILCAGKDKEIAAAIAMLKKFQERIFFISDSQNASGHSSIEGVEHHTFEGPHPAGLVSTHIAKLSPINKGETVWYITASQLALIGEYLITGKVPTQTTVALTGPEAPAKKYYKVLRNAQLSTIVADDAGKRVISGNVLNGTTAGKDGFLSFYDNQVTVIQESGDRYYVGDDQHWSGPGFKSFSVHNTFFSKLLGKKKWNLPSLRNGGIRPIVQSNVYDEFVPLDIFVTFLAKACIAEDIDRMEQLGIYEIDSEDVALCTFACPSKVDISAVIADGLALIEKEG